MIKIEIYAILLLILVAMPLCSASDYTAHKQNRNFELVIQSNNATSCNLSYIQYPDNSKTLMNLPMTQDGSTFYISVASTNYSQLGSVCHGITCTDDISIETGSICREITPSGFISTLSFYILFIVIIVLIFIMGIVLQNKWIMMLGSILVLILGFFIIINGIDVIKDTTTTWAVGIVVWALGIYFIYLSVEEQLKEWD